MDATEGQRKPVDVPWLAIYVSEHAKARLRTAQLAALKANRGAATRGGPRSGGWRRTVA